MAEPGPDLLAKRELTKARAYSLGFCLCGVTDNSPLENFTVYHDWLDHGFHGEMAYLASERHVRLRQSPIYLAPWVKSILVVAWPYPLNPSLAADPAGQIAGYVGTEDYHHFIPAKLQLLTNELAEILGQPVKSEIYCDSSPVLERELAVRAGLGWIGRNSSLISPKYGSALLLAEVFLDTDLPPDLPFFQDLCGSCQKCMSACPTHCIQEDRVIDAGNCISTWTIENKGTIPAENWSKIGNHLFGCDVCQTVCPWNQKNLSLTGKIHSLDMDEMISEISLSENQSKEKYKGTALLRSKHRGWIRNLCIILANQKVKQAWEPLVKLLISDNDPVVRLSTAVALEKIDRSRAIPLLTRQQEKETDTQNIVELEKILKRDSL